MPDHNERLDSTQEIAREQTDLRSRYEAMERRALIAEAMLKEIRGCAFDPRLTSRFAVMRRNIESRLIASGAIKPEKESDA